MQENPMDIFDEMDRLFSRLFARRDMEYMRYPWEDGTALLIQDEREDPEMPGMAGDTTPSFPVTAAPAVEIHRIGGIVKVIADLPGITEDELRLDVRKNTLIIDAGDGDHHFRTSANLPPVDSASLQTTLKNGILEVTFTILPDPSGNV